MNREGPGLYRNFDRTNTHQAQRVSTGIQHNWLYRTTFSGVIVFAVRAKLTTPILHVVLGKKVKNVKLLTVEYPTYMMPDISVTSFCRRDLVFHTIVTKWQDGDKFNYLARRLAWSFRILHRARSPCASIKLKSRAGNTLIVSTESHLELNLSSAYCTLHKVLQPLTADM
jgi:hypothetical protein